MKKLLLLVAFALCCATTILAQNNNKISYQAVVRDAQNKLVANQPVTVTVSIFNGNTTPAAYSETQTATTNLNGLISLLIGPDGSDFGWNSIEWNNAHVETTVKLNGNTLGTLEMPFTAVPYAMYAEYADSVNVNVIANYLTSHYIPSGSVETVQSDWKQTNPQAADYIKNKPTKLTDFTNDGNFVQDANYTHIDNNYTNDEKTKLAGIEAGAEENVKSNWTETDQNSDAFILNKPENLVQDNNYVHTDNNYTTAEKTKLEGIEAEAEKNVQSNWSETDQNSDAFILNKPENLAYTDADNAFSGSNTFTGNNTFGGDNTTTTFNGAVNFSGAVNASSVSFTCGTTTSDLCTLLNGLQNTISNLQSEINTLKNDKARIDSLANVTDSLANVTKNMPMMGQETFTLTAERASSGEFQLQHAPKTSYIYRMYINGVMVGGSNTGVLTLKENTTDTLKYDASKNGNTSLEEGFKVTIVYWYLPEESTSVIPSGN